MHVAAQPVELGDENRGRLSARSGQGLGKSRTLRAELRSSSKILMDHCIFGGGTLERYPCPNCDAVFGSQKCLDLSEEFINRDYALLYTRYDETDSTDNEIRTFRSLQPRVRTVPRRGR